MEMPFGSAQASDPASAMHMVLLPYHRVDIFHSPFQENIMYLAAVDVHIPILRNVSQEIFLIERLILSMKWMTSSMLRDN